MRLKQHHNDVKLLREFWASYGGSPVFVEITKRYRNLILAFECGKPKLKLRYIEHILKDAEDKK